MNMECYTCENGLGEAGRIVSRKLGKLKSQEIMVIGMVFWQGLSMRDAGVVIGLTGARVRQICKKATKRLESAGDDMVTDGLLEVEQHGQDCEMWWLGLSRVYKSYRLTL